MGRKGIGGGLPKMKAIPGIYNNSGHGIDIIGFSNGQLHIFEVTGQNNRYFRDLKTPPFPRQMDIKWINKNLLNYIQHHGETHLRRIIGDKPTADRIINLIKNNQLTYNDMTRVIVLPADRTISMAHLTSSINWNHTRDKVVSLDDVYWERKP